ncbi:MAG TPA: HRDC domain-containing protein [Acidimicrobiales bacterium]|nr:HRDC domain-containing protein [Acidimicrobiales bacterium]
MGSGSTTYEWLDDDAAFADACRAAAAEAVYAVDTEFHRERTYYPHVALLQLRWADTTVLVDTLVVDMAPLAGLLKSDALPILHAADQDLEVFRRACGTLPSRMFDTQIVANFAGFSTPSLASLTERVVGVRLPKGDRMTDWTRRPLTESQRTYAASDVAHLDAIRIHLSEDLAARGRLEWAEAECAAALARAATPNDPDVAWWRIKEARQCRGQARAIVQELAAWRERRAQATDVPVRFVLADLAVAAIAQAAPATVQQLNAVRGLSGRGVRGDVAEEILAAVARGKELKPEQLRVPASDDIEREQRPAAALAAAWVAQLARQERIDATMLATRADLTAFLAGNADAKLRHGWRAQLVGAPLKRLVDGDAALVFDGNGGLLLEERSRRPLNGKL